MDCGPNGTCVEDAGAAACDCADGYAGDLCDGCAADYQDDDGNGECLPGCALTTCTNGTCAIEEGVAVCTCITDYQDGDGDGACSPDCTITACTNGTCTIEEGIATCTCQTDYQDDDGDGECLPNCTIAPCTNGTCAIEDGVATCTCQTDYQDDDGDGECLPNCTITACTNGTCAIEDGAAVCTCQTDYQDEDGDGECLPSCTIAPCTNGTCAIANGAALCTCQADYQDEDGDGECLPSCDVTACTNGTCAIEEGVATCTCQTDYQDEDGDGQCLPDCTLTACSNGACSIDSGAAVCTCEPGYTGASCEQCEYPLSDLDGNGTCEAGVLYVDAQAAPGGTGLSWDSAFDTLQAAADAVTGGSGVTVFVKEGTYRAAAADAAVVTMSPNLHLYGGFPATLGGTNGTLDDRDVAQYPTILDGDVTADGPTGSDSDHVVVAAAGVRIDGFTIQGGWHSTDGAAGAGISIGDGDDDVTLINCTISANRARPGDSIAAAGGGLACSVASGLLVQDSTFGTNQAWGGDGFGSGPGIGAGPGDGNGGAAALEDCEATFRGVTFSGNVARAGLGGGDIFTSLAGGTARGGAVWVDGGQVQFDTCVFAGNQAIGGEGLDGGSGSGTAGGAATGGAVSLTDAHAVFTSGSLSTNSASGGEGGDGGGTVFGEDCLSGAPGAGGVGQGGAIALTGGHLVLAGTTMDDNLAQGGLPGANGCTGAVGGRANSRGGALYFESAPGFTVPAVTFTTNSPDDVRPQDIDCYVSDLQCSVGATCEGHVTGSATCVCNEGYTGAGCTECDTGYFNNPVDGTCGGDCAAESFDCNNQGTCDESTGQLVCTCNDGYQGLECEECEADYVRDEGQCWEGCALVAATCDAATEECTEALGLGGQCVCAATFQDNDDDGVCELDCANAGLDCGDAFQCDDSSGTAICALVAHFVDDDAALGGDGLSWDTAVATVQEGIGLSAAAGGGPVFIKEGTYRPDGANIPNANLDEGISLYGGFAQALTGTDATLADRTAGTTVLDGDLTGDGPSPDDAVHVVILASNTILDGLTVQGGYADGPDAADSRGAGVLSVDVSNALLNDVSIINNTVAAPEGVAGSGGGLFCGTTGDLGLTGVIVGGNVVQGDAGVSGGGIAMIECDLSASVLEVSDNTAAGLSSTVGVYSAVGGGVSCDDGTLLLNGVSASGNQALGAAGVGDPGGIDGWNGGAAIGGAFSASGCTVLITSGLVSGNSAIGGDGGDGDTGGIGGCVGGDGGDGGNALGGGFWIRGGELDAGDTLVTGNTATGGEAGLGAADCPGDPGSNGSDGSASGGGLQFADDPTLTLDVAMFVGNTPDDVAPEPQICVIEGTDCGDNGVCVDDNGAPACECLDGYQDEDGDGACTETCEVDPTYCVSGSCSHDSGTRTCSCDSGWDGTQCDVCADDYTSAAGNCVFNAVFVDDDLGGGPGNTGASWELPFGSIQEAVDYVAAAGGTVLVKEGTYRANAADAAVVTLAEGVRVYGGFAQSLTGTDYDKEARDPEGAVTLLDGDWADDGTTSDDSDHVVVGAANGRIDGFVIEAGYDDSDTAGGAGVQLLGADGMVIADCVIRDNLAAPTAKSRDALGGAVLCAASTGVIIERATLTNNQALGSAAPTDTTTPAGVGVGGGLYATDCDITLDGVTVFGNVAEGGAGALETSTETANNPGKGLGGGIAIEGGTVTAYGLQLDLNSALGGRGTSGGTSSNYDGDSGANGQGGGAYVDSGTLTVASGSAQSNNARGGDGGDGKVAIEQGSCVPGLGDGGDGGDALGAGFYFGDATLDLGTTTVSDNTAIGGVGGVGATCPPTDGAAGAAGEALGGGVYLEPAATTAGGSPTLSNNNPDDQYPTDVCVTSGTACDDGDADACTIGQCMVPVTSVLTCADQSSDWKTVGDACGTSEVDLDGDGNQTDCVESADYATAQGYCEAIGGRLCTWAEIEADTTRGTGCGWDNSRVWTTTSCGGDSVLTLAGGMQNSGNHPLECTAKTTQATVRCCADVDPSAATLGCNLVEYDATCLD